MSASFSIPFGLDVLSNGANVGEDAVLDLSNGIPGDVVNTCDLIGGMLVEGQSLEDANVAGRELRGGSIDALVDDMPLPLRFP